MFKVAVVGAFVAAADDCNRTLATAAHKAVPRYPNSSLYFSTKSGDSRIVFKIGVTDFCK